TKIEAKLAALGFKTKLGQTLYEQGGFLAGNDELCATEFMSMISDNSIRASLTMRGGWRSRRILDKLDYRPIGENPKIIMGFSDITALVNAIHSKAGLMTYHGPCGYSSWGDFTTDQVINAIVKGDPYVMSNPGTYTEDLKTWSAGKARGKLVGGNLTVI